MHTTTSPGGRVARLILRGTIALAIPLLSTIGIAGPAVADPGDPADQAAPAATTATTMDTGGGPPPRPPAEPPAEQAQVPADLPAAPSVPPNAAPVTGESTGGAAGGAAGGAGGAGGAGEGQAAAPLQAAAGDNVAPTEARVAADTTAGERVVICKYVRKPFVAEVAHHVIIVNEQALVGRGFTGTFPWAFSDGQFHSVAVRFAAKGEQAREVSLGSCPRQGGGEPPTEPGGPGGTETLPGPAGVTQGPGSTRLAEPPAAATSQGLPQTGTPAGLEGLLLYALASFAAGLALLTRKVRTVDS